MMNTMGYFKKDSNNRSGEIIVVEEEVLEWWKVKFWWRTMTDQERCLKQFVVTVTKVVKFLLDQLQENQFIVLIVLKQWEGRSEGQRDQTDLDLIVHVEMISKVPFKITASN